VRVFLTLVALISVLAWLGYENWARNRPLAQVLFGFAGLFAVLLIAAFFGVF